MGRLLFLAAAPLLLASCLLSPGRFTATLDIRADRSFTFAYQGEAVLAEGMQMRDTSDEDAEPAEPGAVTPQQAHERRAAAAALAREVGYRSVEYLGGDKFRIDYGFTGRLDRSYVFPPFNAEGAALIPWLAIEVRKDGTARLQAPGFGDESGGMTLPVPGPGAADQMKDRFGTFTFTTDAQLVMQNNEAGVTGPGTRVVWQITPTTKSTPTAVVRFAN